MVRPFTQAAIQHSSGLAPVACWAVPGSQQRPRAHGPGGERHLSPEPTGLGSGGVSSGLWEATAGMQLTSLGENPGGLPAKGTGERQDLSQDRGGEGREGGPGRSTDRAKALRQG